MNNKILSYLIPFILFVVLFETLSFVRYFDYNISDIKIFPQQELSNKSEPISSFDTIMERQKAFLECRNKDIFDMCEEVEQAPIIKDETPQEEKKGYTAFRDLLNSHLLMFPIYLVLIYTISNQLTLYTKALGGFKLSQKDYHDSKWNINSAPMFGLLGTFISLIMLIDKASSNEFSTILITKFYDILMTTIIGIIFYVINLRMHSHIEPAVKDNA